MIIAAIVLGLIIMILIILINYISSNGYGNMDVGVFFGGLVVILCVIEIAIVNNITEKPHPTPIDVYKGKTTLEYTVRDGEVIDSVVVWKGDIYNED